MNETRKDLITRLRKIEGQVKGIQRMIEKEEDCTNILVQIAAVRSAVNKVGGLVLENYSKDCVVRITENSEPEAEIKRLIETIVRFTK